MTIYNSQNDLNYDVIQGRPENVRPTDLPIKKPNLSPKPSQEDLQRAVRQKAKPSYPRSPPPLLVLESSGKDQEVRQNQRQVLSRPPIPVTRLNGSAKPPPGLPKMISGGEKNQEPKNSDRPEGRWYRRASNYSLDDPNPRPPSAFVRGSVMCRSSSDLRSQSYLRESMMSHIMEERRDHLRSRSVERSENELSSLETNMSLYTDKDNSDSETTDTSSDYVLDTTAYVCSVIDSIGLSEEERSKILMVVARDERLRIKEKQRIV